MRYIEEEKNIEGINKVSIDNVQEYIQFTEVR
jgi:hypothetical protein